MDVLPFLGGLVVGWVTACILCAMFFDRRLESLARQLYKEREKVIHERTRADKAENDIERIRMWRSPQRESRPS
jgi:hypothetical protein